MPKPKTVSAYFKHIEGTLAHPILMKAYAVIKGTAPQIEEKIKWGAPSLEYKGVMITLVAFKNHAAIWFHKGALLQDKHRVLEASSEDTKSMRKYILTSPEMLNETALRDLVLEAVEKNETGEQVQGFNQRSGKYEHSALLNEALENNPRAQETFEGLTDYKKREYIEHIESAKQQATKERRLQKAMGLLEKGLGLNDKYRS